MPPEPVRVVVLLDASASIRSSTEFWQNAVAATARLVRMAPPEWSFALTILAKEPKQVAEFGADRDGIRQALAGIRELSRKEASGRTALCDSIAAALTHLGTSRSGDVILAVTDGLVRARIAHGINAEGVLARVGFSTVGSIDRRRCFSRVF
jgi:hypothetical protein